MTSKLSDSINAEKALIFRNIHCRNLQWVANNGLHCGNSTMRSPSWKSIGNAELIQKRATYPINHARGGYINDYVPFYFTPRSPMLLNIKTGYRGVEQHTNEDILVLVTSLHELVRRQIPFLFTESHANGAVARFYDQLTDLHRIDWAVLQNSDFKSDANDPRKMDRYQAETLVDKHCPFEAIRGIGCYNEKSAEYVRGILGTVGHIPKVLKTPGWYF